MSEVFSNVIPFPLKKKELPKKYVLYLSLCKNIAIFFIRLGWTILALLWPLLVKIFGIDLFFQFIRMLWLWNDKQKHAGLQFFFHLCLFMAFSWFVCGYNQGQKKST